MDEMDTMAMTDKMDIRPEILSGYVHAVHKVHVVHGFNKSERELTTTPLRC